jgi:surface antigen
MRPRLGRIVGIIVLALLALGYSTLAPAAAEASAGTQVANRDYGYPYPNAPDCDEYGSGGCVVDAWRFYQGQCTSWTAFRLNSRSGVPFSNSYGGRQWGDASNWGNTARALGIPVNGSPAVGAVVWYASGHVGYVEEVRGDGSVVMSEMNADLHNGFQLTVIRPGYRWPSGFIHIKDLPTGPSPITEGSFVRSTATGRVYRVVGGAPIYVSNWGAFGGPQPYTDRSQGEIDALRSRPADGTYINSTATGRVYVIAGGAPLYVSNWANVGGARPVLGIDQWALDNINDPNAHLNARPANGTFIVSGTTGRVYIMAGGAPIYVSNWNAMGGPKPTTAVDQWALDNWADPNAHTNPVPEDGTFINSTATGRVYVVAGGAPIYVSSWESVGGGRATVGIDQWALDNINNVHAHLRARPADGTFVNTSASRVYRFAGGAPLLVTNWALFGGTKPSTRIDQWAIDNAGNPEAHVDPLPRNGTVLRALPSGERWTINAGRRQPAASGGIDVDGAAVRAISRTLSVSGSANLPAGGTTTLSLTGTGFAANDRVTLSNTGLTLGALTTTADSAKSGPITAAAGLAPGRYDVKVTAADGASATCTACVEVAAPAATPTPAAPPADQQQVLGSRVVSRTVNVTFGRAVPKSASLKIKGVRGATITSARRLSSRRYTVVLRFEGEFPTKKVKIVALRGARTVGTAKVRVS